MENRRNPPSLAQVAQGLGTSKNKVQLALLGAIFLGIADYFFYVHGWDSVTALYAALPGGALVAPMAYDCICAELDLTP